MEEIEENVRKVFAKIAEAARKREEKNLRTLERLQKLLNEKHDEDLTPVKNKKRVVQLSPVKDGDEEEEEDEDEPLALLRPVRTARIKAVNSLKEPKLNSKLRRPDTIKQERISEAAGKENRNANETVASSAGTASEVDSSSYEPSVLVADKKKNEKKRKPTEDETVASNDGAASCIGDSVTETGGDATKKLSVEVIPIPEPKIEVVSDDELMPPPPAPAPKPRGRPRTKKQPKGSDDSAANTSKVKSEKLSADAKESKRPTRSTRTKQKSKANSTKDSESEPGSDAEPVVPPLKPVRVKVERLTNEKIVELAHETASVAEVPDPKSSQPGPKSSQSKSQSKKSGQSETSSVYEDAIDDRPMQATFVKPTAPVVPASNTPKGNHTFAVPSPNATFDVVQSPTEVNSTYTLSQEAKTLAKAPSGKTPNPVDDSIMTEDRSDEEAEPTVHQPVKAVLTDPMIFKNGKTLTKKPELFNPNIQSPIKAKIQAFEKAAKTGGATFMSPANTRLKTRIGTSSLQKINTPKVGTISIPSSSTRTPIQLHTATSAPSLLFQKANSTSKVIQAQKKTGAIPKQTRDSDRVDEVKKAAAAAEERKRKREEKARLAQLQREQMEKERLERLEQKKAEDEERLRKFKQQQEQLRLQKAQEQQKREELVRLEQQKRAYELEAIKNKQNESLQRKAVHLNMLKNRTEHHDFTILHSDDSTDDEGKMNKKRPVPPAWSRGSTRRNILYIQNRAPLEYIDALFSVQPLTVNLKEIFPNIEPRKLKRNSSAVWNTPPRYSEIQKQIHRPF